MGATLAAGAILDEKYEILGLLGAGGMGEVYKARHIHLNAFRCIKLMKAGLLADETYRSRFLREARMATQIHHPNVAVVHDFDIQPGGQTYMVTEFIDGTTIRQFAAANGRCPLPLAAEVAVQVLTGLDFIHRRGLLHRDISADNIMLSYDADEHLVVKIIDLGVAKDISASANTDSTQAGMLVGNPKYMSPEQLGELPEGEQLDGRADLYCLGVVLYEMLLGVPPFVAKTPNGYIVKHLMQPPPPFSQADPKNSFPDKLEPVVFKSLEKDRRRRYADARAFAAALQPFLARPSGTYTREDVMGFQSDEPTLVVTSIVEQTRSDADTRRLSDEESFQVAWEEGTPTAWQNFLDVFPDSKHVAAARELFEEATAFETAKTETGLREFLRRWPESRHRMEAEIRLVEAKKQRAGGAFAEAVAAGTYAAMRDFLIRYAGSEYHTAAEQLLAERLAFETAAGVDTEEAWESYLASWTERGGEARTRLAAVLTAEGEAWDRAMTAKDAASWEAYLAAYPRGKRSARADLYRREAAAFEDARQRGRAALDAFVRGHPDAPLAREARRLARIAADQEDFAQAHRLDTAAAWSLYLMTHPGGTHADEARQRLVELEDAAYAALLTAKDVERAADFLRDFPQTPRRSEIERLKGRWEAGDAARLALEAIGRGELDTAAALIPKLDDERRGQVESALDGARDERSWNEAISANAAPAFQAYLQGRPNGRWAADAKKKLARLQALVDQDEPHDWDVAWEKGTAAGWDAYLARHPESARAAEARHWRQEAAEFEIATSTNTPTMWRAFLKAWPEGRHRLDAELRLRATR